METDSKSAKISIIRIIENFIETLEKIKFEMSTIPKEELDRGQISESLRYNVSNFNRILDKSSITIQVLVNTHLKSPEKSKSIMKSLKECQVNIFHPAAVEKSIESLRAQIKEIENIDAKKAA